jgi:hypothetical protein
VHTPALNDKCWPEPGAFDGAGLWVVEVQNERNQSSSPEEVEEVDRLVSNLLRPGAQWIDRDETPRAMTKDDILVVAPFNAQISLLEERLGPKGDSRWHGRPVSRTRSACVDLLYDNVSALAKGKPLDHARAAAGSVG